MCLILVEVCALRTPNIQTACATEAKSIFLKHVDGVIFVEITAMKSSYLTELSIKEYQDSIGFRERVEKNRTTYKRQSPHLELVMIN